MHSIFDSWGKRTQQAHTRHSIPTVEDFTRILNGESAAAMEKQIVKVLLGENSRSMSAKEYDFWTNIPDLKKGDLVACDTVNGIVLGSVIGYAVQSIKVNRWVVSKINTRTHEMRIAREKEIAEVKRMMAARRKKLEDIHIYEMMARTDTEMAELLHKLNMLNGHS